MWSNVAMGQLNSGLPLMAVEAFDLHDESFHHRVAQAFTNRSERRQLSS